MGLTACPSGNYTATFLTVKHHRLSNAFDVLRTNDGPFHPAGTQLPGSPHWEFLPEDWEQGRVGVAAGLDKLTAVRTADDTGIITSAQDNNASRIAANYPTSRPPREAISRIRVAWPGFAAISSRTLRPTWALSEADIELAADAALRTAA